MARGITIDETTRIVKTTDLNNVSVKSGEIFGLSSNAINFIALSELSVLERDCNKHRRKLQRVAINRPGEDTIRIIQSSRIANHVEETCATKDARPGKQVRRPRPFSSIKAQWFEPSWC